MRVSNAHFFIVKIKNNIVMKRAIFFINWS